MSNIFQLPDATCAEQEAGAWFARLQADDVCADDRARFEAWRAAHPRNARAYEALTRTIEEVKRAGPIVRAVSFGTAMNESARTAGTRRWSRPGIFSAAAALAIAVATGWWVTRADPQTLFQTAVGEHASVELPDGSRLELNSNSVARVQYAPDARVIMLTRGEAYFQVAHEPQRPFWVVAGQSWIRAVGTAFNVDLRPSGVRVIVSEGTVKVAAGRAGNEAPSDLSLSRALVSVLTAGQQAEVTEDAAHIRPAQPMELLRVAAWRKGRLYFENRPLEGVVGELGRYTDAQILIEDQALRRLPIGGTFQANAQGLDALLNMLREGFGLRVHYEDGRITISQPPTMGESSPAKGSSR